MLSAWSLFTLLEEWFIFEDDWRERGFSIPHQAIITIAQICWRHGHAISRYNGSIILNLLKQTKKVSFSEMNETGFLSKFHRRPHFRTKSEFQCVLLSKRTRRSCPVTKKQYKSVVVPLFSMCEETRIGFDWKNWSSLNQIPIKWCTLFNYLQFFSVSIISFPYAIFRLCFPQNYDFIVCVHVSLGFS